MGAQGDADMQLLATLPLLAPQALNSAPLGQLQQELQEWFLSAGWPTDTDAPHSLHGGVAVQQIGGPQGHRRAVGVHNAQLLLVGLGGAGRGGGQIRCCLHGDHHTQQLG